MSQAAFNPFDPFGLHREWHPPRPSSAIAVSARRADGLHMVAGRERVTLRGDCGGAGVSVSLDERVFALDTSPGWTALTVARRLAAKVNASGAYVAVVDDRGASVELRFARR